VILKVLPSLAWFASDAGSGQSLLQQSINNLLLPLQSMLPLVSTLLGDDWDVSNLMLGQMLNDMLADMLELEVLDRVIRVTLETFAIGEVTDLEDWAAYGVDGIVQYLKVDTGELLAGLLESLGVLDLLEDTGLTGLLELLNYEGKPSKRKVGFIQYPVVETVNTAALYNNKVFWSKRDARKFLERADFIIDSACRMFFGGTLGDFLGETLTDTVYNAEVFDDLVGAVQDALAGLDLDDIDVGIPGVTVQGLLEGLVTVGGEDLDLLGMLDKLQNFTRGPITGQESFIRELVKFLSPIMPILDLALFDKDLALLPDIGDDGLVTVYGYAGYKFGVIPALEAFGYPLGVKDSIKSAKWIEDNCATDEARLAAVLKPVFEIIDVIVQDPVDSLLALLPNLLYFITTHGGVSPLEQSLNNSLFAITSLLDEGVVDLVLGLLAGDDDEGDGLDLMALLGDAIGFGPAGLKLDINALIDGLLADTGFEGLDSSLLDQLLVGTLKAYNSRSGAPGDVSNGDALKQPRFISMANDQHKADLITALLRVIIGVAQENQNDRLLLIDMLADMLVGEGNLGYTTLRWGLQFYFWVNRVIGLGNADYMLWHARRTIFAVNLLLKPIMWLAELFDLFGG